MEYDTTSLSNIKNIRLVEVKLDSVEYFLEIQSKSSKTLINTSQSKNFAHSIKEQSNRFPKDSNYTIKFMYYNKTYEISSECVFCNEEDSNMIVDIDKNMSKTRFCIHTDCMSNLSKSLYKFYKDNYKIFMSEEFTK